MSDIASKKFLWLAAAAAILSACTPTYPPPITLGNSVLHNQAVHIVNPNPHWGTQPPDLDGQRAALLMHHYTGQTVIQPTAVTTGSGQ